MSQPLAALETPIPVVELDIMQRNLERMAAYASQHGLSLRPHVKTHKSPWIAALQLELGATGVTCATPREAEVMSPLAGDILLAYPPVGELRAARIASLSEDVDLTVALDSREAINAISRAAQESGRIASVLVELDLGMGRVGVQSADQAARLAHLVMEQPSLEYAGIAFYPGHVRQKVSNQDAAISDLSAQLSAALSTLSTSGAEPRVVSGGSTPTAFRTHEMKGVTEFRPGTYVFNDRTTAEIGACARADCALTVLARVVSTAVPGQAVIDAGTKALGREPLRAPGSERDPGYGELLEHPEVTVRSMSEEHGILDLSRTEWRPSVGDLVRVIPNHVCIVVHLNEELYGMRGNRVVSRWDVEARGRRQASA